MMSNPKQKAYEACCICNYLPYFFIFIIDVMVTLKLMKRTFYAVLESMNELV